MEGFSDFPVVRFDHLTDAQKRAEVIADSKIAEQAGWDREILAIELGELIDLLTGKKAPCAWRATTRPDDVTSDPPTVNLWQQAR